MCQSVRPPSLEVSERSGFSVFGLSNNSMGTTLVPVHVLRNTGSWCPVQVSMSVTNYLYIHARRSHHASLGFIT